MSKKIPVEQLIFLSYELDKLPIRDIKRKELVSQCADDFGVSVSTVYRQIKNVLEKKSTYRKDFHKPRACSEVDMRKYCEVIAAMRLLAKNKKRHRISTPRCINLLETTGVYLGNDLIIVPRGFLKKSTINRYLSIWGLNDAAMCVEPVITHFEAKYSNECWQFDFTPSDLKKIKFISGNEKLLLALFVDDASGAVSGEYIITPGESAIAALSALYNATSGNNCDSFIKGIPESIYMDNGSFSKSELYRRVLMQLNISVEQHLPKDSDGRRTTARSKGKVERANRTFKDDFESLFHFQKPESLKQLNQWLHEYIKNYNHKAHRRGGCSRYEYWKSHLPDLGYQEMCSKEHYVRLCRTPEPRTVGSDACISVNAIVFQLDPEFAGETVNVLHGIFDDHIYIEHQLNTFGPFYPYDGPIPFGTYKKKPKINKEKRADYITELSKKISIPISALSGLENNNNKLVLIDAQLIDENIASKPFKIEDLKQIDFKSKIEAKQYISNLLSRPLSTLSPEDLNYINGLVTTTLNRHEIKRQLKAYFSPKLIKTSNSE
ncbi:MAG: transposase [Gammaproteobacteria bacterium]|nr:MAG: transposase [Gammaproteobacteria bacterium]UTW41581.1 transposase [bacterium SCSIO 12844]